MGSEVTLVTLPRVWLGLWSLHGRRREGTQERTLGVQPFDSQVKSCLYLGSCLTVHYVEMVRWEGPFKGAGRQISLPRP